MFAFVVLLKKWGQVTGFLQLKVYNSSMLTEIYTRINIPGFYARNQLTFNQLFN